jgi:hypothetical protein
VLYIMAQPRVKSAVLARSVLHHCAALTCTSFTAVHVHLFRPLSSHLHRPT